MNIPHDVRVYRDHLKPGEYRPPELGPWCWYVVQANGHILQGGTGCHTEEEALAAALAVRPN